MSQPFFMSNLPPLEDGPEEGDIDVMNDETFGSGAVDEDWEGEHNQFVEQQSRSNSTGGFGKPLDEDELELSNRQLAAAVEELVLNSDQDQDAIDPAIVSLRKESRHGYYNPRITENLVSPYMGEKAGFGRSTPPYSSHSSSSSSVFQSDGIRNIWSNTELESNESLGQSPSLILERQLLNDKLKNMMKNSKPSAEFEDEAILSAVKATPQVGSWPSLGHHEELLRHTFPTKPTMLRAEDLEREFSKSDLRGPSPTFGISIPKDNETNHNGIDRSLPARSVSPVIGSPTSHALPIGTPPKHVTDLLQHAHKQGIGMPPPQHPGHPMMPVHLQGPPQGFMMPPGGVLPQPGKMGPPNLWPSGMLNRAPMNPLLAQDIMNKMGISKPLPLIVGSPPANMSPMGSPRFVQAPRLLHQPNANFGPQVIRPGPVPAGFRGPMAHMRPLPDQRFGGPPMPPYLGPGHLHPEHSRFVRMRRQQSGRSHSYNNQHHHRSHNRDRGPRDPHSNLMTNREKEWVIKIQMMALQSDRPEIDDYYYQHYIEKRLNEGRLSLDDENSDQKRLITPTKTNPDHKKYVPVQYDNSLGKLTASSVYSPRQVIDVIHPEKEEDTAMEAVDAKISMNKRLEIYSVIEKAYTAFLEMEEIKFRAETGHDELHDKDEIEEGKEKTEKAYLKMLEELLFPNDSTEIIFQCLRIRKGKRLICRVLPHVSQKYALKVILTLLKQLPVLIKRDQKEDILQEFYHPVRRILKQLDSDRLLEVCSTLLPVSNIICRDKFGFSILCKLLVMAGKSEELKKNPRSEIRDQFLSECFKAFLAFGGKKKSAVPTLLENKLESKVVTVLENHSKSISASDARNEEDLREIKNLLSMTKTLKMQSDGVCS